MSGPTRIVGPWRYAVVCLASTFALTGSARTLAGADTAAKTLARQILDGAGVKGGLIVHVGCGDGKLTACLCAGGRYLVHGLDADATKVGKAREHIRSLKLSGKVTVERWDGSHLPCTDNLVNLLVSEDLGKIAIAEVMRVLCPGGVAYVKRNGRWTKTVKPRPDDIDEWTHFLHDATGNAVARDARVGPPRHMQWMAEPIWTRNHHTLASISAVVSSQGRIFYIVDEATAASMEIPGRWFLVARDAFSGVLLWRQPMASWAWHRRGFRSGPVQLPRTLVAAGDRVYAPLAMSAPVTVLDATTGKILRTCKGTEGAEEVVLHDDVLMVVTGSPLAEQAGIDPARRGKTRFPNEKSIVAIQADTGKRLWRWSESGRGKLMPLTLVAEGNRVFFQAGKGVVCLEARAGKEVWRSPSFEADKGAKTAASAKQGKPGAKKKGRKRKGLGQRSVGWSLVTLVACDDLVFWAKGGRLRVLSAQSGKLLWDCPCGEGFRSPVDLFVVGDLVWLGPGFSVGRDVRTGQVKRTSAVLEDLRTAGHHHRCYREKATQRYVLSGHRGVEFFDLVAGNHSRNNWVRGVCQYGVLPCNGLVYAPAHSCGCYMEAKLYGFWALAAERDSKVDAPTSDADRLERGPAYGQTGDRSSKGGDGQDWPTLRGNPLRSGSTGMALPAKLEDVWESSVGGRPSAPVVADGAVLVSSIDVHRVIALDAQNGEARWEFLAGGRVDSPPTVWRGLALFGCADGWVYCLRMSDGKRVWRFQAAPANRKTVALDQVESIWPVHGNVLVEGGVAYVAAGRSSHLDGGIYLYGLDPATGGIVCRTRVHSSHPKAGEGKDVSKARLEKIVQNATDYKTFGAPDKSDAFSMGGATTDVLVSDGQAVFMRHLKFDPRLVAQTPPSRHLFSTSRLLDGAENHRSHWVLGTGDFSRMPVAYSWIAYNPSRFGWRFMVPHGLILTYDAKNVWGVRRIGGYRYQLFCNPNRPFSADEPFLPDFRKTSAKGPLRFAWTLDLPIRPRAMIRAGNTLLVGGMPRRIGPRDPHAAYEGREGGLLWAVSPTDGKKLTQYELAFPPVWDGLAVANGRLYLATCDGRVRCMGRGK